MPTENKPAEPLPEVKRWQLKGFIPGVEGECKAVFRPVVVLASDFDATQAELAALREAYMAAGEREHSLREELQTRTADLLECGTRRKAAEHRNAELIKLLREVQPCVSKYTNGTKSTMRAKIDNFLKSIESGVSEADPRVIDALKEAGFLGSKC